MEDLFRGKLVRLAADDPETASTAASRWSRNPEYQRLLDTEPPQLWSAKKIKDWIEKDLEKEKPDEYYFKIHILDSTKRSVWGFAAFLEPATPGGIGIGSLSGKRHGTDAMRDLRLTFRLSLEDCH
jgi:hypothetical protein